MATLIRWFLLSLGADPKEFLAIFINPANRVTLIAPVFYPSGLVWLCRKL